VVDSLVAKQTDPVSGALVGETQALNSNISSLDDTVNYWQTYLDNERTRLTSEFNRDGINGSPRSTRLLNYLNQLFYSSSSNTYKTSSSG